MNLQFSSLPTEILLHIFQYLSLSDIGRLMLVSKDLYNLIENEKKLWKSFNKGKLLVYSGIAYKREYNCSNHSPYNHMRISYNWEHGLFKEKIVIHHQTNYLPWSHMTEKCYLLSIGSELFCYLRDQSGLPKCSNPLWSLKVPTIKRRTGMQIEDITRFVVKDGYIVCGNRDGCVSLYKRSDKNLFGDTLLKKPELFYFAKDCFNSGLHEVTTVDAVLNNGELDCFVTGTREQKRIKVWKPNKSDGTFYCSTKINVQNVSGIKCLKLNWNENLLAVGASSATHAIVYDFERRRPLFKLKSARNVHNAVRDVFWHDDSSVAYVTHFGDMGIVDLRSGQVWYSTKDPFGSAIYCVKGDRVNSLVLGSSEYSRCVLYDIRCPTHRQIYFTQKKSSPVYSLEFDTSILVAAADKKVAALDFNVAPFEVRQRDYSKVCFR